MRRERTRRCCSWPRSLKSPIVHALGGKEHVEWDNPYDVGMTGFIGFSSGFHAMMDCDVLLMLGTDFPYRQFYPTDAKIAQVDLRPENLGRRCKLDLGLVGDVASTIEAVLPRLALEDVDRAHLDNSLAHYAKARRRSPRPRDRRSRPQTNPPPVRRQAGERARG